MPRLFMGIVAAIAVGDLSLGVISLPYMPASTPVHWNWRGDVDRYGSPWELALAMPAVAILLSALLIAISLLPMPALKTAFRQPQFGRVFGIFSVAMVVAVIAIHAALILFALGYPIRIDRAALFLVAALILCASFVIAKIPRNPIMGIRTPWTLASDEIWLRTHRIGSQLFVAYGLAILLTALVAPAWAGFVVLLAGALALVAWSMVYSHRLYRQTL